MEWENCIFKKLEGMVKNECVFGIPVILDVWNGKKTNHLFVYRKVAAIFFSSLITFGLHLYFGNKSPSLACTFSFHFPHYLHSLRSASLKIISNVFDFRTDRTNHLLAAKNTCEK